MTAIDLSARASSLSDELIRVLGEYVAIESPTGDALAIGTMTDRLAADFLARGAGLEVDEQPTGNHLAFSWEGSAGRTLERPLLFLAHSDTVWPKGTLATMPWRIDGDTARGPGVFDMKGGIVAFQGALDLLSETGSPHRPITLLVTADEEIGSPTSSALVARHARAAHAAFGLEPAHPDGALKTSRWGSTRVRMIVTGREAHAALDAASGVSAIDELVDQLGALRLAIAAFPSVLCNVGTVAGGGRTNVVAGQASAEIGMRFVDAETELAVLAMLGSITAVRQGATVRVEMLSSRPAWTAGPRHDELCSSVDAAAALVGQSVSGRPASGAADTNISGSVGTPSIDGLGVVGRGAHSADEQIQLSSLADRAALLAAIIIRL